MKELPKMYRNRIEKELNNNECIFSTMYSNKSIDNNLENRNINIKNKMHQTVSIRLLLD